MKTSDLLLSLATAPLLAGLWGSKVLSELTQELGQLSEEVLRGDRLPVLNFPQTKEEDNRIEN